MSKILRVCASFVTLHREDCAIPERCVAKGCELCGRGVHYDPMAAIPALGIELIACDRCVENRWTVVQKALE